MLHYINIQLITFFRSFLLTFPLVPFPLAYALDGVRGCYHQNYSTCHFTFERGFFPNHCH